jgi:hypothetical protein
MRKTAFYPPSGDVLGQLPMMEKNSVFAPAEERHQHRPDALGETARGSR